MIMALATLIFLFANIYAVRKIMRYGAEAFFYDKMLVAYQAGAEKGLKEELNRMLAQDNKSAIEVRIARDFKERLPTIIEPGRYLSDTVAGKVGKVKNLRQLRVLSFLLLLVIFLARVFLRSS